MAAALASRIRAEDEILAEGYYRDVSDKDDEYGSEVACYVFRASLFNFFIPQMCQPCVHEREDEVAAVVHCPLLPGQLGGHGGLSLQPLRIAGPQGVHPYKAGKIKPYTY